ncbi:hypothetical protein [Agrobacterium sp.]|uniref:hypothetical protein n=1 Tax=Agrobacterium sp. TaxID=361 RepID=UPI0028AEBFFE|nr:hypothetical protein [Agrobacterium sp.]
MSASIARYLKDFGESQPVPPVMDEAAALPPSFADFDLGEDDSFAMPAPVDVDEEKRISYAEGHEAATAALTEQFEAEKRALLESHAAEIAEFQARYHSEMAGFVASRLQENHDLLVSTLDEQICSVLAPVMSDALVQKAVSALADIIRPSLIDGEAVTLTVKGPRALYDLLIEALGGNEKAFRFVENADVDLSVEMDNSVLVTRMSAWASSVRKVLK